VGRTLLSDNASSATNPAWSRFACDWKAEALIDVVAVYCRALLSTGLEGDNSIEELTDIALELRERVNLSPHQRYRLGGVGLQL
jgi:hypothetical protein